jgi:plastocyanin
MKVLTLALALVPLAACSSSSSTPCTAANAGSPITAVSIVDYQFNPSCFAVAKGTTVTFTNHGSVAHTATSLSGPETFDSGQMAVNQAFQHAFGNTAGTEDFHCLNHPQMTGTIIIQ